LTFIILFKVKQFCFILSYHLSVSLFLALIYSRFILTVYKNWIAVWHFWVCCIISWVSFYSCSCSSCPFMSLGNSTRIPQLCYTFESVTLSPVSLSMVVSCSTCLSFVSSRKFSTRMPELCDLFKHTSDTHNRSWCLNMPLYLPVRPCHTLPQFQFLYWWFSYYW